MIRTYMSSLLALLSLIALLALSDQALADDDDDGDDDEDKALAPLVVDDSWQPVLALVPGQSVEDLFRAMGRVPDGATTCPMSQALPLMALPLPPPDAWACVRLTNTGDSAGVWRVDFEGTLGAGYTFEMGVGGVRRVVMAYPGPGHPDRVTKVTAGRRLASVPIVLGAGQSVDLFAQIEAPADVLDADPILQPELAFDTVQQKRAHGFGALLGASALLLLLYVSIAHLLQSTPAWRYAVYFAATSLAMASNEGYLNALVPGNPALAVGALDKGLEAAQISAHLFFMAAFLREAMASDRLVRWLHRLGWVTGLGLLLAALGSYLFGGPEGLMRYYDLGFELDPLLEDPFSSWPLLTGAVISATWYIAILTTAAILLMRRANGSVLFAIGAVTLVLGMVGASFSEELFEDLGDDNLVPQFILLFDGLIFAAAMVLQTFGLRDQRDEALRLEYEATQDKIRLTETLLESRHDLDRARALAETHRSKLALTGHDLRQPLTSLHLALSQAEKTNPELGQTLRASLDYLRSVLNATVADTRPDTEAEDDGGYHTAPRDTETVGVDMLFANAVRMFEQEARDKGLVLRHEPTPLQIDTTPVAVIRILSNLVSNAVKYTQDGEVVLRASRRDGAVALDVQDSGPGLTPEALARIQQTYMRGDNVGEVEGDGLGLSSARDFARSLGARLEIRSTPGQGSCFALEGLPEAGD